MTRQPMPPGLQGPGQQRPGVMESFYDFFSGLYPGSFVANGALPGAVANNSFFNPMAPGPGAKEVENMPPMRRNQSQERGAFNKQAFSPSTSPSRCSPSHASRGMGEPLRGQSAGRLGGPPPAQQEEWYGEPPPARDYQRTRDPRQGPEFDRNHDYVVRDVMPPSGQEYPGGQDCARDFAGREYPGRGDYPGRGEHGNNRDFPGANEYGSSPPYPGRSEYGPGPDYGRGPNPRDPRDPANYREYGGPVQDHAHEQPSAMPEGWQDYSCPSFPVPPYGGPQGYGQDVGGVPPEYGGPREQPAPAGRELPQRPPSQRADSRDLGRGHEMRQISTAGRRPPTSPAGDRRPQGASPNERRMPTSPSRDRHGASSSTAPGEARPPSNQADREDLLDQHVNYYLRKHPEARKKHTVSRRSPGVYNLDGREVAIEWQYASEPGKQGHLVVVDGPLRQPFADYMEETEANAKYEGQDIGVSNLHGIPKDRRISFNDQHKVYSRLEAMKVAKEQALAREKAAAFVKEGKEVPVEIMTKYKKTIQQKLGLPRRPASPQRSKRAPEAAVERDAPELMLEAQQRAPQHGTPQHGTPQHGGPQHAVPQRGMSPPALSQHGMPQHGAPPQGMPPQCLSPQSRSPKGMPPHGFGMPPGSPQHAMQQGVQQQGLPAPQGLAQHQDLQLQGALQQHPQQGAPQLHGVAQQHLDFQLQGSPQHQQQQQQQQQQQMQQMQQQMQQPQLGAGQQGAPHGYGGGPQEQGYPAAGSHGVQRFSSYTPPPPPPAGLAGGGAPPGHTSSPSYTPPPVAPANMAQGPQGSSSPSYTPPPQSGPAPAGVPPLPGVAAASGMSAVASAYAPAQGGGQSPHGGAAGLQGLGAAGSSLSTAALPTGAPVGTEPLGSGPIGTQPLAAPPLGFAPLAGAAPSSGSSGAPPLPGGGSMTAAAPPIAGRGTMPPMHCPSMGVHASAFQAMTTPAAGWRNTTPMKGRQLSTAMAQPPTAWPGNPALAAGTSPYGGWMR